MSAVIDLNSLISSHQLLTGTKSSESDQPVRDGTDFILPVRRLDTHLASTDLEDAARNAESVDTAQVERLRFRPVIRLTAPYRFQALKRWEGVVTATDVEQFTARLRDLDSSAESDLEAVVSVDEIADSDEQLLEVGAVFYWTIGYRIEPHGQKSSVSTIRFRRLPVWTSNDRKRLSKLASDYDAFFDGSANTTP
jgi:hypothetical protein